MRSMRNCGSASTRSGQANPASHGRKPSMERSASDGSTVSARGSTKPATSYGLHRGGRRASGALVNIRRVSELSALGIMRPKGAQAFELRTGNRSEVYAYEQRKGAKLSGPYEKQFRANKKAWEFFQAQPPWYRKTSKLVGDQRQERRDASEEVDPTHPRLRARANHTRTPPPGWQEVRQTPGWVEQAFRPASKAGYRTAF